MAINWQVMKEDWTAAVRAGPLETILEDRRFTPGTLAERFETDITTWRFNGAFRPVTEIGNEIAAALCLLERMPPEAHLTYEPPIPGTDKRIDFHRVDADGQNSWVEVKSVSPQWCDDDRNWQRFQRIAEGFPDNAQAVVDRNLGGAAIGGQLIAARWSFIGYTLETEERAALLSGSLAGPVSLLLCARNNDWHRDDLEDFADLYRTGRGRDDDPLRNAVQQYMADRGLVFERSLVGFHFLGRRDDSPIAFAFDQNVEGPAFGR